MIQKRNKFWTVIFAFLPGAGHMFNGFMKLGVSFMGLFFAVWALAAFVDIGAIGLLTPIIWFYSFFDCINRVFQEDEDFYSLEDKYLFNLDDYDKGQGWELIRSKKLVIGIALVVIGVFALWDNLVMRLVDNIYSMPYAIRSILSMIDHIVPPLIVALFIIWGGIVLIKSKKEELEMQENKQDSE